MIRHPLHSAIGRSRPDVNRVTDGIAASLRQFSISARRSAADENDKGKGNGEPKTDGESKPSRSQRTTAAVNEIVGMLGGFSPTKTREPRFTKSGDPSTPRNDDLSIDGRSNEFTPGQRPNIIRGGFRGRGNGRGVPLAPSRGGSFASSRGGVTASPQGGRFSGRFGGGDGGSGMDDRPRRARGRGGVGGGGGGRRGRRGGRRRRDGDEEDEEGGGRRRTRAPGTPSLGSQPHVQAYLARQETGQTMPFKPSLTLESLAGFGPAVASSVSNSTLGAGETVMRAARTLGGGSGFHPTNLAPQQEMQVAWRDGSGVFVPPSDAARTWTSQVLGRMIEKSGRPFAAPAEVKTAVLEDALRGTYDGPGFADPADPLTAVHNYVRRDATWNADAGRAIEAKIRSMISRQQPQPQPQQQQQQQGTGGPTKTGGAAGASTEAKA
ncbi:hypothetical protein GGR52DRAFT_274675 [Hypoxylon sp. FL1284]|nr:hypothetical protein GGR52DRAFT_274675 [Hypoxylon sp. FL1284]